MTLALAACVRPAPPPDVSDDALSDGAISDGAALDDGLDDGASPSDGLGDASVEAGAASGDASGDASADGKITVLPVDGGGSCTPGEQVCVGVELATCSSAGDGYTLTPCFPGQYCDVDHCVPLENNLILVFDTSGSMSSKVPGVACKQLGFPSCDPAAGCSRMDVSKTVFKQALDQVDPGQTRLALLRFPQLISRTSGASCAAGYLSGLPAMTGDPGTVQHISAGTGWYWQSLSQVLCVPFPANDTIAGLAKLEVGRWMDGKEVLGKPTGSCVASGCAPSAACGVDTCCDGGCVAHAQPELRSHGGTPIGRTLFYVGEYLRHRVFVDGRTCVSDAGCANPNYRCVDGTCQDPARHCRETVVVLFTDGGQADKPADFFGPRAAAKRLAYGLSCDSDAGCVGGATCQSGRCLPPAPTGYRCLETGLPCVFGDRDPKSPTGCAGSCLLDLVHTTVAKAKAMPDNVLRSPDGAPFGVRVNVVDISDNPDPSASFHLASAGGGRLFTASSVDPLAFVSALTAAFDMKNKKVCGTTL